MGLNRISLMVSETVGRLLTQGNFRRRFLDSILALGITGIEPLFDGNASDHLNLDGLADLARDLADRKMQVPCVALYVDWLAGADLEKSLETIGSMLIAAKALGASLVMPCGSKLPTTISASDGRRVLTGCLDQTIKMASNKGLNVGIESVGMTPQLQATTQSLAEIYDNLQEGPCLFVGDLANPCYGDEKPIVSLKRFRDKLIHTHVKDVKKTEQGVGLPSSAGYWLDETEIGKGVADISDSLAFLKAISYTGWYSLETARESNVKIVARHLKAFKQLLNKHCDI
ncbi:MAG: TIM barrel protein [Actinobacteria bacterium]|nr:TIM barrel protein [Actinomycetota bacterium]